MDDPEEVAVAVGIALARAAEWKRVLLRRSEGVGSSRVRQITVEELRLEAIRAVALNQVISAASLGPPVGAGDHAKLVRGVVDRSRALIEKSRASVVVGRRVCQCSRLAVERARRRLLGRGEGGDGA